MKVISLFLLVLSSFAIFATPSIFAKQIPSNAEVLYNFDLYLLQQLGIDPTQITISISGDRQDGMFTYHARTPNSYCIPAEQNYGIVQCGNNGTDVTNMIKCTKGRFSLYQSTNNVGPYNKGVIDGIRAYGYWESDNSVHIRVPYRLTVCKFSKFYVENCTRAADVPIVVDIAGKVHQDAAGENYFLGYFYLFSVAGIVNTTNPYQDTVFGGPVDSRKDVSIIAAYRALNAYNHSLTQPAPYYGQGKLSDLRIEENNLRANASFHSIQVLNNRIEFNNLDFFSDFELVRWETDIYRINSGIATDFSNPARPQLYFVRGAEIQLIPDEFD